jgi:hypothetical protein
MSTVYAGVATNRTSIHVPNNSDVPSGGLFATPHQETWDQILFERARIAALEGGLYGSPIPLTRWATNYLGILPFDPAFVIGGSFGSGQVGFVQQKIVGAEEAFCPLDFPTGTTVTGASVSVDGSWSGNTHGGMVGNKPALGIMSMNLTSGALATEMAFVTDTSANQAAYEAVHSIVISGALVFAAGKQYFLVLRGEAGANAQAGCLAILTASVTKTLP